MNPREFRIGNYLVKVREIVQITATDLYNLSRDGGELYEKIILTEEWLVRLQFDPVLDEYIRGEIRIKSNSYGFYIEIGGTLYLKYVHKLQNIHFELTGNECDEKNHE